MERFIKKPLTIRATRIPVNQILAKEWFDALEGKIQEQLVPAINVSETNTETVFDYSSITVSTLEGMMFAKGGDWIIEGINGELCPIKDDVFNASHEPFVEEYGYRPVALMVKLKEMVASTDGKKLSFSDHNMISRIKEAIDKYPRESELAYKE
ncbi:MAG: hypothetical protein DRI46_10965 [Chloroflexi bacterium]|nr:MAG: hypothetical protein DRI46_10965 [Chloroflexota bacterium]